MQKQANNRNTGEEITLAEIGGMILALDKKIDNLEIKLNKKVDGVENNLSAKINNVESSLSKSIAKSDGKIDGLDRKMGNLDKKIDGVEISLSERINTFESAITSAVAKGFEEVHNRIDTVDRKIDAVAEDLSEFKDETNEGFRKVRNDIWNLDERFVTKQKLRLG